MRIPLLRSGLLLLWATSCSGQHTTEEITFQSGPFTVVGDLKLPQGTGPFPVVLFVHGDGPNSRNSGGTYPPIQERMLRAGYATFAWDKPGTGESTGEIDRSRLQAQRAQIVLDAIAAMKQRPDIDSDWIGMWGISQAGYVMPRVLQRSDDIAFMIAVSCPGLAGVYQGAYLVSAQAVCAGLPEDDREEVELALSALEHASTYDDYVARKAPLAAYPVLDSMGLGTVTRIRPRDEWHVNDLEGDYFWDPMPVVERTTFPVLAVFGGNDTQIDPRQGAAAYRAALAQGGHPHSRVELFPGTDHNIIISETGCLSERSRRPARDWDNYPPGYLDTIEEWLRGLRP